MIIADSDETRPLLPADEQQKYNSPSNGPRHTEINPAKSNIPPIEPLKYSKFWESTFGAQLRAIFLLHMAGDAYRAAHTVQAALENDPLQRYLYETPVSAL